MRNLNNVEINAVSGGAKYVERDLRYCDLEQIVNGTAVTVGRFNYDRDLKPEEINTFHDALIKNTCFKNSDICLVGSSYTRNFGNGLSLTCYNITF